MTTIATTYPMISAQDALDQGSGPSLFYSIARVSENPDVSRMARTRARELSDMMGFVRGVRRERAGNDNRRGDYGKPRNRRAA